jgi:hypothetical protein
VLEPGADRRVLVGDEVVDHQVQLPAAHQHSAICPSRQRGTLAEWVRQMEIMLSMASVERSVRASVGPRPGAAR